MAADARVATESDAERYLRDGSGPLADLALTLPVFLGYHLGVAFLPVRNAADMVTHELVALAHNDWIAYAGLTLSIGLVFTGVLLVLGREQHLRWQRFLWVGVEGAVYAAAMRFAAGYVVGKLHLSPAPAEDSGAFAGAVMSLGAGFYEELVFRVGIFGLGLRVLRGVLRATSLWWWFAWAAFSSALFSSWHYVGEYSDTFELRSFVFRWVCGLAFVLIYAFRGFSPAVFTHTLYDLWVMVF